MSKLTGPKKAAILMLALGEDGAADVMKNMEEQEIQQVGFYMNRISEVTPDELDQVLQEYYQKATLAEDGLMLNGTGDFVKRALTKAIGGERANSIVDNLKAHQDEGALESLKFMEPHAIASYITHEHPQTIALIMAHLDDLEQTSMVLRTLPEHIQADVVYRMAVLESIPAGVIAELDDVLSEEMKNATAVGTKVGGIHSVAEILNTLDPATETRILASIEENNPDLSEQIRELMFTFEDLVLVEQGHMPIVISQLDEKDLILSLKTASDEVKAALLNGMSGRVQNRVREELADLGLQKISDVQVAQQKIVKIVREMADRGDILINGRGGGTMLV